MKPESKSNDNANYTAEQETLILEAVKSNGGKGNKSVAETLAADPRMNKADGSARNARSIIAKMTRMDGVEYERQQPTTKNGQPVAKKLDLVQSIANLSGVTASKLDGLEKAPKLALESIRDAFTARTGTEG